MNDIHNHGNLDISQFYRLDINLYPLFVAIFEQKSISKAAQILCISQSAVSHALQKLRQQLNDDLFVRTGHKMLPTPCAEQIYPPIKQALLTIQNITFPQYEFDSTQLQFIKIAVHDEIEPFIFPQIIQHFQKINKNIQFISHKLDRKNMLSDLRSQQVDFIVDLERPRVEHIHFEALISDHFVVCSQQHSITIEDYLKAPHIGVSSRRTGHVIEDIFLNRQQLSRQMFIRCQHYSTALQILVFHPQAMLTIPKRILHNLTYDAKILVHTSPIILPKITLGMYWSDNMHDNLRHQFLRREITQLAKSASLLD